MDQSEISSFTKSSKPEDLKKVLIIVTGGTFCMEMTKEGLRVKKNFLKGFLENNSLFCDKEYTFFNCKDSFLATPITIYGKRILYKVYEIENPIDSANVDVKFWVDLIEVIEKFYEEFDSFIILHGTDTLAYTSSILSFALENLAKPVIITGSQIPITKLRNDAQSNLWNSLIIATHFYIPEVIVLFGDEVFRGNRCRKVKGNEIDAFASPNYDSLVKLGFEIKVNEHLILVPEKNKKFSVQKEFCEEIAILKYNPLLGGYVLRKVSGIEQNSEEKGKHKNVKGIIIESYGVGNLSFIDEELCQTLQKLSENNVIVINLSQCLKYQISTEYECGKFLAKFGVINGYNMTIEGALAKLSYLLGKNYETLEVKRLLGIPMRGELTIPKISQFKLEHQLLEDVFPTLFFYHCDDEGLAVLEKVKEKKERFEFDIKDINNRTALHYSARNGQNKVIRFLLQSQSVKEIINSVDKDGRSPKFEAYLSGNIETIELLENFDAEIRAKDEDIIDLLFELVDQNNLSIIEKIIPELKSNAELSDEDGFTIAHYSAIKGNLDVLEILKKNNFNLEKLDNRQRKFSELLKSQYLF